MAADITAKGGVACVVVGDLAAGDKVAAIVEDARAAIGPLSLLVNSASMFEADAVGTLRADIWNHQFAVNAQAPVLLAQAFAAQVADDAADPSIVNLIDQRVLNPRPDYVSYYLSKSVLAGAGPGAAYPRQRHWAGADLAGGIAKCRRICRGSGVNPAAP